MNTADPMETALSVSFFLYDRYVTLFVLYFKQIRNTNEQVTRKKIGKQKAQNPYRIKNGSKHACICSYKALETHQ